MTAQTAPRPPTRRRTPQREPLAKVVAVTYHPGVSTPWVEVYTAPSDKGDGTTYDVRFEPRADPRWSCNCLARVTCKHIRRADHLRRVRWWSAMLAGQPPSVLRAELARREERITAGWADDDDHACADFCRIGLGEAVAA